MSEPETHQPELILDLNPIIFNASNSPDATTDSKSPSKPQPSPDIQESNDKSEDALSTSLSISKRTCIDSPIRSADPNSSSRANAVKIKDLLESYSSTRRSTELSNQYRTVDPTANISVEMMEQDDDSQDESVEVSRSFCRANSANGLGSRNRLNNSAFLAAYQPDTRDKIVLQDFRKKNSNLKRFTPLDRSKRPQSSHGYRQNMQTNPSMSPERRFRLDESTVDGEYSSVRMETAPDGEYVNEDVSRIVEDRKETAKYYKQQGVQKYENKVLRQELERQMKMLENRVKRLTSEDQNMKKNIRKTGDIMNKALTAKQRVQDDIMKSQELKMKRLQEEQKAREKNREERMRREVSIKGKMLTMQKEKAMNASNVKMTLQQEGAKMNEELRKEDEKRQRVYQNTADFEKMLKMKKKVKQLKSKEEMDENHLRFLQEEHMKTLEIEKRIQQLARKEDVLIDQIKATHQIQVKAENIMRRVLTTKVERNKQFEFR